MRSTGILTTQNPIYLKGKLEENISMPKKLWDNLKSLGYSNKNKSKSNIVLRI